MGDHYYTNDPASVSDERVIVYRAPTGEVSFTTDRGVFSGSRVDFGSDLLIRTVAKAEEAAPASLFDIGCGYGPIGLSLGLLWPQAAVCMADVNERAMALAAKNAQAFRRSVTVVHNQENPPAGPFEVVVTNPPIRAGKATVYGIFAQAHAALTAGGRLYVVIQKKQGADSAVKEIVRLFGNCGTIARDGGFHILRAVKEGPNA